MLWKKSLGKDIQEIYGSEDPEKNKIVLIKSIPKVLRSLCNLPKKMPQKLKSQIDLELNN